MQLYIMIRDACYSLRTVKMSSLCFLFLSYHGIYMYVHISWFMCAFSSIRQTSIFLANSITDGFLPTTLTTLFLVLIDFILPLL